MALLTDDELYDLQQKMAKPAPATQYPLEPSYNPDPAPISDGLGHWWDSASQSWQNDSGGAYQEPASAYPLEPSYAAPASGYSGPYGYDAPYVTPQSAPGEYGNTWADPSTAEYYAGLSNYQGGAAVTPEWWEGYGAEMADTSYGPSSAGYNNYNSTPEPAYPDAKYLLNYGGGQDEYMGPAVQQPAQESRPWWEQTPLYENAGEGINWGDIGSGIKNFAQDFVDVTQGRATQGDIYGLGATPEGGNQSAQFTQDVANRAVKDAFSGNALLSEFGVDATQLPYGLEYVTDTAFAPATWATIGAGSSVPVIGSALGGNVAKRAAGEIALGTAGYLGGEKSADLASEYTDNPYLIGAAGLAGGVLAGGAALGGIKAAGKAADATGLTPRALFEGEYGGSGAIRGQDPNYVWGSPEWKAQFKASTSGLPEGEVFFNEIGQAIMRRGEGFWYQNTWPSGIPESNAWRSASPDFIAEQVRAARAGELTGTYAEQLARQGLPPTPVPASSATPPPPVAVDVNPPPPPLARPADVPPPPRAPAPPSSVTPPPPKPPTAPPTSSGSQGMEAVPLGDTGARAAIDLKTRTTATAGPLGRAVGNLPGVKAVAGAVNPSVNLDPKIHIANQADAAVRADLSTQFSATRAPLLDQIDAAFTPAPAYIGPAENPIKGTFIDIAENPADYVLTPEQKGLLDTIARRDAVNVNKVRGEYGGDVGLYTPKNEGAIYLPHINANEDVVKRVAGAEASLSNPRIAKERVWDTARERAAYDPTFKPETEPARLLEAHDNALANMAGKNTFAVGAGGLNKLEAMEQAFPELAKARAVVTRQLDSVNGKLDTALRRQNASIKDFNANASEQRRIENRMGPIRERLDTLEASGEFGPELSHLSGQFYELQHKLEFLRRLERSPKDPMVGKAPKVYLAGERVDDLMDQAEALKTKLLGLTTRYKNANLEAKGLVMNPITYKYHPPEVSESINAIKRQSNGVVDKLTDLMEGQRATALSSDPSPVTVQGQLNLFRDPVSAGVGFAKMIREGGPSLNAIAREEPELVSRYVKARGVPFGNVSPEFSPAKSWVTKIPKAGPAIKAAEDKMFEFTQRLDYEAWKRNVSFLEKFQPGKTLDELDHETANLLSKTVPGLSSVERGVAPARGRIERSLITSTSFAISPALLAKDAASGLAKIAAHPLRAAKGDFSMLRGRELLAVKQGLTLAATIEAVSLGSAVWQAEERGLSPEMAIRKALNPDNKVFMALQLPGGVNIPLGGPLRSFIRGVTPKYRDGEWHEPDLLRFAESKLGPSPGMTVDLVRNKDYQGNTIRSGNLLEQVLQTLEYIGESTVPLTAGAVAEGVRTDASGKEIAQQALGQGLGTNTSFPTPWDDRDVLSRKMFGDEYRKLDPLQRKAVDEANGGKVRSTNPDAIKAAEDNAKLREENVAQQLQADDKYRIPGTNHPSFKTGKDWREDYHTGQATIQGQYQARETIDPFTGKPYGSDMDKAIAEWGAAIDAARNGWTTDWDKVDEWRAANPDRAALVDKYMAGKANTDLSPMVTEYKKASKLVGDSGFFDIRDNAWQKIVTAIPALGNFEDYYDWRDKQIANIRDQIVAKGESYEYAESQAVSIVDKTDPAKLQASLVKRAKAEWMLKDPDAAIVAWRWGYLDPTNDQEAYLNDMIKQGRGK